MKIGFLGPKGTFTHGALCLYAESSDIQAEQIPYHSILEVVTALQDGKCDQVVIPVENSIEGSVTTSLDLLVKTDGLEVTQEIVVPIHHCVMARDEFSLDQVTDILSHPQALAQCRHFIFDQMQNASVHQVSSTALGGQILSSDEELRHFFANSWDDRKRVISIGPEGMAAIYGLKVLKREIQDYPNNSTRFFVISKSAAAPTGHDKTSLVFSSKKDQPGSLVTVLSEFADRSINLTSIASRPSKTILGEYLFFIDFEGHKDDKVISEVLDKIRMRTSFLKVLGSYRRGD